MLEEFSQEWIGEFLVVESRKSGHLSGSKGTSLYWHHGFLIPGEGLENAPEQHEFLGVLLELGEVGRLRVHGHHAFFRSEHDDSMPPKDDECLRRTLFDVQLGQGECF